MRQLLISTCAMAMLVAVVSAQEPMPPGNSPATTAARVQGRQTAPPAAPTTPRGPAPTNAPRIPTPPDGPPPPPPAPSGGVRDNVRVDLVLNDSGEGGGKRTISV